MRRETAGKKPARRGEHPAIRRARGYLRVPASRISKTMVRAVQPELRDIDLAQARGETKSAQRELNRVLSLELAESRRRRRGEKRFREAALGEGWATAPERKRAEVFNRELARLALEFGGMRDDAGQWEQLPHIIRFRRDLLGGRTLKRKDALDFVRSEPLAFLSHSHFIANPFPIPGHKWHRLRLSRRTVNGRPREEVEFELKNGDRAQIVGCNFSVPLETRVLSGPAGEKSVLAGSVLGELQRLSADLARHYMWEESEACWFILTGCVPYPAFFKLQVEGGGRHDHSQYRVNMRVPLWVRSDTISRMLKAVRRRYVGQANRPLSERRLELVDFAAPLRHAGRPWREIAGRWNKKHPRRRYSLGDLRNFERDFSETYRLLMWTGLSVTDSAKRSHR